ncbi:MAG TPA: hypothetical protein VFA75_11510 [Nevskia sp.]|jgi:hypothetical protein|nr:hypothetical protein [Nevskia sp.]
MKTAIKTACAGALLLGCGLGIPARAADLSCKMSFTLKGWSAIYKSYSGAGTIRCSDGSTMKVKLTSVGGGLTAGKSSIDDGRGDFSGVKSIRDIPGDYVSGGAGAGAVKSAGGQVLTKGEVTLAISGTGRGWDVGVDLGKFTIAEEK